MRRFVLHSSGLLAITLAFGLYAVCATTWKLVLKNGKTVECDGAPIIVNDAYLFRTTDGKDSTVPAEQVDRDQTDRANKIASAPRQWPIISESVT